MTSNALALCTAVLAGTFAAFPSAAAERHAAAVADEYWTAGSPGDETKYYVNPSQAAEETCATPATTEWELWSAGTPGDSTSYYVPKTPPEEGRPTLAAATEWTAWRAGSVGDVTVYYIPQAIEDTPAEAAAGDDAPSRCARTTNGANGRGEG
jgi:hypothetical protein